ncbi:MAG TPA: dynamin family protein [Symbiobacteriaceae bacterium]|nr:dynamin family protein [Symbiobacteriaceae bacterium]
MMLQTLLPELERLARDVGETTVQDGVQGLARELARGHLRLAVVGPVGAGKSSLINALLGRPLLPEGSLRTTGRVVAVTTGGGAATFEGNRPGGPGTTLTESQFQNACLGAGRWASVSASVAPAEPLPLPITLLDTPGLDSAPLELPDADALIVVVDYRSELPPEIERLAPGRQHLLRVINFCPSPLPDQRTVALEQRLTQLFGSPAPTLRIMDRSSAGLPETPIRSAMQDLLAQDPRVRLAHKTLVWEALKLWQQLDQALTAHELDAATQRTAAAAAQERVRRLEALQGQALDAVTAWRKRVAAELASQVERLEPAELDARCADLDLAISQLGAELRTVLRDLLDQAPAVTPVPAAAADAPRRWATDPFVDTTPPVKQYLVKLQRDLQSRKADLLARYSTAADDLASELGALTGRHFAALVAAQQATHRSAAAAAQTTTARLASLRTRLQALGESLRRLSANHPRIP